MDYPTPPVSKQHVDATSNSPRTAAISPTEQRLRQYLDQESADKKTFRRAVAAAVLFHLAMLAVTFPSLSGAAPTLPDKAKVYVVEVVRFKAPDPPKDRAIPPERQRREPMPDPTPHDPEPVRDFEPAEFDQISVDDLVLGIEIPEILPEPDTGPTYVTGDVQKPVKLSFVPPRYTEIARKARIQGRVILQSTIDEAGNVVEVSVVKGLPMGLSEAAIEAVRQWKFKPATLHGKPVAVYFNLTVTFNLQ